MLKSVNLAKAIGCNKIYKIGSVDRFSMGEELKTVCIGFTKHNDYLVLYTIYGMFWNIRETQRYFT